MNRPLQLVLLLHLPFSAYGMNGPSPSSAESSPSPRSSSDFGDLDDVLSMSQASASSGTTNDGLNSTGSVAEMLGISQPASERTFFAGIMRYAAKQSGLLDISGAKGDETERTRTARIIERHADMLAPGEEIDLAHLKQFLERQAAAEYRAMILLKKLQAYNEAKAQSDIVRKIEQAERLLTLHEGKTLSPLTAGTLQATLQVSRKLVRDKLDQANIQSSDS